MGLTPAGTESAQETFTMEVWTRQEAICVQAVNATQRKLRNDEGQCVTI